MTKEHRLKDLADYINEQHKKKEEVFEGLQQFTSLFYNELEKTLISVTDAGANLVTNIQKGNLTHDLQSFSFEWGDVKIIVTPVLRAVLPNPDFKSAFLPLPEELVGRIVIFHQFLNNPTVSNPIGEIYVFPNGKWYASGISGIVREDTFDENKMTFFALSLLENITRNIIHYHVVREDTIFDPDTQMIKNPLGFSIPDRKNE